MSSKAGKLKNKIKKQLKFPIEMYNSILGSYIVCLHIFNPDLKIKDCIKTYKKEKAKWLKDDVNEKTWMEDLAKDLKVEMPYDNIALVISDWNRLIAPYIDISGKGKEILPIREDRFMGPTLLEGTVHPIKKEH